MLPLKEMDARPVRQDNLGGMPISARLRWGGIVFGSGIVLGALALELHVSRLAMSALFIPFYLGANGILMGLYRTCPPLALRGLRDLGAGSEKITSQVELHAVRMRALRVILGALVMALMATASLMLTSR